MNLTAMRDLTQVDPLPRTLGEKVSAPPAPTPVRTRDPALSPRVVEGADGKLETKIPENEGARAAKLHDDPPDAEHEGWAAYQCGYSNRMCPYKRASNQALLWQHGWTLASKIDPR